MFPILLSLGPLKIYTFGLFVVLAVVFAGFMIWREGYRKNFDQEKMVDLLLILAVFGLIGARAYYILTHLQDFLQINFFYWLFIFHFPGLSFWGGMLGGLAGLFWFSRKNRLPFWELADAIVLGLLLGEIIGRIGAFFSGSAYGIATHFPWGVSMIGLLGKREPVQIYESLTLFIIFIIIIKLMPFVKEKKLREGVPALSYLLLLSLTKFALEFLRGDSVYFLGWRVNQIVSLFFILISVIVLYKRLGRTVKTDLSTIVRKIKNIIRHPELGSGSRKEDAEMNSA